MLDFSGLRSHLQRGTFQGTDLGKMALGLMGIWAQCWAGSGCQAAGSHPEALGAGLGGDPVPKDPHPVFSSPERLL